MSNLTNQTAAPGIDGSIIVSRIANIIIGFGIILLNSLVFTTIFYFRKLRRRRELVIFGTFAVADALCGVAYASTSIRALNLIFTAYYNGNNPTLSTAFQCMFQFHNMAYVIGTELMTLMLLVVSVDRLISICSSRTYGSLYRPYYTTLTIGIPASILLASFTSAFILSSQLPRLHLFDAVCNLNIISTPAWYLFHSWLQLIASGSSVLVYCVVLALLRRRLRQIAPSNTAVRPSERRQLRMTKTLGLVSCCTLFFYVIPNGVLIYVATSNLPLSTVTFGTTVLRMVMAASSCLNMVIYLARSSDVRIHIANLWRAIVHRQRHYKQPKETLEGQQGHGPHTHFCLPKSTTYAVPIGAPGGFSEAAGPSNAEQIPESERDRMAALMTVGLIPQAEIRMYPYKTMSVRHW